VHFTKKSAVLLNKGSTSPAKPGAINGTTLPADSDGAFRCPECESLNDHAHFSRRKGGVLCQVCGVTTRLGLAEFLSNSAVLVRKMPAPACPMQEDQPSEEVATIHRAAEEDENTPPQVEVRKAPKVSPPRGEPPPRGIATCYKKATSMRCCMFVGHQT